MADDRLPPFVSTQARLGDKLQYLARMAPTDIHAIEVLVDACLYRAWRETLKAIRAIGRSGDSSV